MWPKLSSHCYSLRPYFERALSRVLVADKRVSLLALAGHTLDDIKPDTEPDLLPAIIRREGAKPGPQLGQHSSSAWCR